MLPNLISNIVDVGGGSLPPMGQDGLILSSFRNYKEGSVLPSGLLLQVVQFIEKYVKLNFGDKNCKQEWKDRPHLSLPDMLTSMEFAYSIVLYESMKRVWDQEIEYRASTAEEKQGYIKDKVPKYHCGKGTRLPLGQSSMTQSGVAYLRTVSTSIDRLRKTTVWVQLNIEWREYSKKYHSTFFKAVQGADYQDNMDDGDESEEDEEEYAIELPGDDNRWDDQGDPQNEESGMESTGNDYQDSFNEGGV